MSMFSKLCDFSQQVRKLLCMFVVVPLFAAGVPMTLSIIPQSYDAYRGLSERGVEGVAQIRELKQTGGRSPSVIAISSFVAEDGRRYTAAPSFYPSETYRMRPGHTIKIIYDRSNPSNNAPSLKSARLRVWANGFAVPFMAGGFLLLIWIFRNEYRLLWSKMRTFASQPA